MDESRREELDSIRVILNLERLGELIGFVAAEFAAARGIDPPDFEGTEMRELAISSYRHIEFMADRSQFEASVSADLDQLDRNPFPPVSNGHNNASGGDAWSSRDTRD